MFELIPIDRHMRRAAGYDPFRDFEEMERNFFGGASSALAGFRTDVSDTGEAYKLECELPGFKKEDIHVDVDGDTMTIRAERHSEHEDQDKKGNYVRCERSYGSYARSFDISGVKAEGIKASYNDGVLSLTMPKKDVEVSGSRRLAIE